MRRWWPYLANGLGWLGCGLMLVYLFSGRSMTRDTQIFWVFIAAVWIGNHAWLRWMYDKQTESRDQWRTISDGWRRLYNEASSALLQKRRSMWS